PAGFHRGSDGWTSPLRLVARTMSAAAPAGSLIVVCHGRNEYLPRSRPSCVGFQVLPPSLDTATSLMPWPPSKAMPRTTLAAPALSLAPSARLVMNERTSSRAIGTVLSGLPPGGTQAHSLSGMRYAVFIQKLSNTVSITVI